MRGGRSEIRGRESGDGAALGSQRYADAQPLTNYHSPLTNYHSPITNYHSPITNYHSPHPSAFRELTHWAIGSLVLALLLRTFVVLGLVVPVMVSGRSMEPTLGPGDRVFVDRATYLWQSPARGDVIVFRCPDRANELCVKRIVGLPGESMEFSQGRWSADGRRLVDLPRIDLRHEDLAVLRAKGNLPPQGPIRWKLAPDEYFVVGDNWAISDDSRNWWRGPGLAARLLVGRALGVR